MHGRINAAAHFPFRVAGDLALVAGWERHRESWLSRPHPLGALVAAGSQFGNQPLKAVGHLYVFVVVAAYHAPRLQVVETGD